VPQATPASGSQAATGASKPIKYVALGDSYTIGTSVKPRERWPNQLMRSLNPAAGLDLVGNLAVNGATTEDVIDAQLDQLPRLHADFVSLLVGVNDVVRGAEVDAYRTNLRTIFSSLLAQVPADRILLVTIPDYTLTPAGANFGDPGKQSSRVRTFNEGLRSEASQRQILLVDITPVADQVRDDASLVADDGLHPSGKQYAAWVELIAPEVRRQLNMGYGR
jgi:lysophospholipase L1-like esterase